jgi:hypothetical protein
MAEIGLMPTHQERPRASARCARHLLLLALLAGGCATTRVSLPELQSPALSESRRLIGAISFSGDRQYLPRMLVAPAGDTGTPHAVTFKYSYEVSYETPRENALHLFNPLLLVGVPKGTDRVAIEARLDVLKGDALLRSYQKSVSVGKNKTIFAEGATLTDLRRQGLLLVRDHIDKLLVDDLAFLGQHVELK